MSVMVLLVLAVVWVVALTPMVLRKLSERQVVASVTDFSSRLGYLRSRNSGYGRRMFALAPVGFSAAAERLHENRPFRFDAGVKPGPTTPEVEVAPPVASKTTMMRRRRVLASLVAGTVLCFLFGLVPALSFMWYLALVGLVCGVLYVGLLVHFHRLAVERAQKVVALETRRHVLSALEEARVSGVASSGGATWTITGSHPGGQGSPPARAAAVRRRAAPGGAAVGAAPTAHVAGAQDRVTFAGVASRR